MQHVVLGILSNGALLSHSAAQRLLKNSGFSNDAQRFPLLDEIVYGPNFLRNFVRSVSENDVDKMSGASDFGKRGISATKILLLFVDDGDICAFTEGLKGTAPPPPPVGQKKPNDKIRKKSLTFHGHDLHQSVPVSKFLLRGMTKMVILVEWFRFHISFYNLAITRTCKTTCCYKIHSRKRYKVTLKQSPSFSKILEGVMRSISEHLVQFY